MTNQITALKYYGKILLAFKGRLSKNNFYQKLMLLRMVLNTEKINCKISKTLKIHSLSTYVIETSILRGVAYSTLQLELRCLRESLHFPPLIRPLERLENYISETLHGCLVGKYNIISRKS